MEPRPADIENFSQPLPTTASLRLGQMIRDARERSYWTVPMTQDDVVRLTQRGSKQWLSAIERGRAIPSIEALVELHDALHEPATPPESLAIWVASWAEAKVSAAAVSSSVQSHVSAARAATEARLAGTLAADSPGKTLADFPQGFLPLTIIHGDRRSPRGQNPTLGDYFARPASAFDVGFLAELRLPASVQIHTDKVWVWRDEDYLRTIYGDRNLLVIGSPVTNFATRRLNPLALFRFDMDEAAQRWWDHYLSLTALLSDPAAFWVFRQELDRHLSVERADPTDEEIQLPQEDQLQIRHLIAELPQVSIPSTSRDPLEQISDLFRAKGLIDPVDRRKRGTVRRAQNDYATVTLAPNPFSRTGHVAILIGGLHQPGTMHALRCLGEHREFEDHPYGGIIEVMMNSFADEPGRFLDAKYHWETSNYTPETLVERILQTTKSASDENDPAPGSSSIDLKPEHLRLFDRLVDR